MNAKIIILIAIIVILFSINKCNSSQNNLASKSIQGSTTDITHIGERENKFTRWLSSKEYQSRFKNKSAFYKRHKSYPAYIEMDTLGNRRIIDIPYEPRFYWRCTSARSKDEFKKIHIKETLNRGKKLLSLSIINKDGIDIYTGTWVSEDVFERESKKLKKFGISPPEFLE
ncbi:MAG TPA: hypothetical protein ENK39_02635 [Epsilonproteobacteria bacterium]|nr:hypothetical protein [Campylobacterota bacterium]